MSLYWYACISTNTYCFKTHHISLETDWWALSNISFTIYEILANEDFTVTDDLISQSFVVTFVHPTYMWIALIWVFAVQLSLWKSVHWLWRYKLNEVCDTFYKANMLLPYYMISSILKPSIIFFVLHNHDLWQISYFCHAL